ncbi:hypothetical protein [Pseudidiomarina salinarum]|uniref:hypothetical protein n=1 Tax=Pseudidiomarina salinarum TaxID=435908 RepID=UPI00068E6AF5|nr:hypothetical protein [Pseudidiomarina salinarum]RUO70119.1 hypothetical protein CWI79_01220 [Pseudidiomarina salinarum]
MPDPIRLVTYTALFLFLTLTARPSLAYSPAYSPAQSEAQIKPPDEYILGGPDTTVREGYFILSLDNPPTSDLTIQQSADADFSSITTEFNWFGDFSATTLSGFADGTYYFRVNTAAGTSNVIEVEVLHYPLWQAFSLFFAGLLLFLIVVLLIVRMHWVTHDRDH